MFLICMYAHSVIKVKVKEIKQKTRGNERLCRIDKCVHTALELQKRFDWQFHLEKLKINEIQQQQQLQQ